MSRTNARITMATQQFPPSCVILPYVNKTGHNPHATLLRWDCFGPDLVYHCHSSLYIRLDGNKMPATTVENSNLLICIKMNAPMNQVNCVIINTEASNYIPVPLPIH